MTIKTKEDQQEYTIVITQEGVTIKPSKSKCIPVALNSKQAHTLKLTIEDCVEELFKMVNIKS
jgi:hypothetical protein